MLECTNKKFEQMLYAFELNLLSEEEAAQFEEHLLECSSCFNKALEMEEAARMLNDDPDVRSSVEERVDDQNAPSDSAEKIAPATARPSLTSRLRAYLPLAAVLVLASILILKPWQFEISSDNPVEAGRPRLAVLSFEDLTDRGDSASLAIMIPGLLTTALSESQYLSVISRQRLYEIMARGEFVGESPYEKSVMGRVSALAGADLVLAGSIATMADSLVVLLELSNTGAGTVISSARIVGSPNESIFALVDRVADLVRSKLSIPDRSSEPFDRSVDKMTTSSIEAYRAYSLGEEAMAQLDRRAARRHFEDAVELDSTFAMAYYNLSLLGEYSQIAKAVRFLDHCTPKDQYFIRSRVAAYLGDTDMYLKYLEDAAEKYPEETGFMVLLGFNSYQAGNYEDAVRYLRRVLDIDSLSREANNLLAYSLDYMGDSVGALEAIKRYIRIAPGEPNPYDTEGDYYANHYQFDRAIESYRRALSVNDDFATSRINLIELQILSGDPSSAQKEIRLLGTEAGEDDLQRLLLQTMIYTRFGQFRRAVSFVDTAGTAATTAIARYRKTQRLWQAVQINGVALKDYKSAMKELDRLSYIVDSVSPSDELMYNHVRGQLLAQSGQISAAVELAEALKIDLSDSSSALFAYHYILGFVAVENGELEDAANHFELAYQMNHDFPSRFMMAKALLDAGKAERAVPIFEELQKYPIDRRLLYNTYDFFGLYNLGKGYMALGKNEQAAAMLEKFLNSLDSAGDHVIEIEDARRRLAELTS